jgi:hypothetical protein
MAPPTSFQMHACTTRWRNWAALCSSSEVKLQRRLPRSRGPNAAARKRRRESACVSLCNATCHIGLSLARIQRTGVRRACSAVVTKACYADRLMLILYSVLTADWIGFLACGRSTHAALPPLARRFELVAPNLRDGSPRSPRSPRALVGPVLSSLESFQSSQIQSEGSHATRPGSSVATGDEELLDG